MEMIRNQQIEEQKFKEQQQMGGGQDMQMMNE
jgi:hypothetical protein